MKNTACCIISGLIVAAFVSGMVMSARADEDDEQSYYEESSDTGDIGSYDESSYYLESGYEDESSYYFESSNDDESSYYFESNDDDESSYYFESSSEGESSYYFESSSEDESSYYYESSSEDESSYYFESSNEEDRSSEESEYDSENSTYHENSRNENSQDSVPGGNESSIPEEIIRVPYIPRNDPLGWLNGIETVIPSDKTEHSGTVIENETSYDKENSGTGTFTDPEISSLSVKMVTRRVTAEDKGKDSKTAFLVGLIIFSLIGMIATLAVIAFLRSKGMFAPSFLKFEPKKKNDK